MGNKRSDKTSQTANKNRNGYSRELHRRLKKASDKNEQTANLNQIPLNRTGEEGHPPGDGELKYLLVREGNSEANIGMDKAQNSIPSWI